MPFDRIEPTSEMRLFTSGGTKLDNRSNVAAITGFLDRYYVIGTTSYNSRFTEPGESYGKANFTFYGDGRIAYSAVTEITDVTRIDDVRSEEHTSELQSLMRISYAVFCLKKKKK